MDTRKSEDRASAGAIDSSQAFEVSALTMRTGPCGRWRRWRCGLRVGRFGLESQRANSPAPSGPGAHASCAGGWPEVRLPAGKASVDNGRAELTLGDQVIEPGLEVLAAEQIGRVMMELGQIV